MCSVPVSDQGLAQGREGTCAQLLRSHSASTWLKSVTSVLHTPVLFSSFCDKLFLFPQCVESFNGVESKPHFLRNTTFTQ